MQHQRHRNGYSCRVLRALALLALAVLAIACGRASGDMVFVDQAAALDRAQVEAAARPLTELGMTVAVFSVANGDTSGDDFTRRLDAAGLLQAGKIAPSAIALYVSFEPRYSEFRAGADWSDVLPDATLREVRLTMLNPALRGTDATGGVTAALAELDKRARFGPFGIRREHLTAALWIAIAAGVFLLLNGPRALGDWLRWGPLGRCAAALWARTPPGRAQAQRRFLAQLDQARQRAQAAATAARTMRQGMEHLSAELLSRLEHADRTLAELEQRAPDDALPVALDALSGEYKQLHADLSAFDRTLKRQAAAMSDRAAQARERIGRVQNAFTRVLTPRRAKKTRRTISADGQRQLGELQTQLAQLDQQRAAFEQAALPLAERQDRLTQLTRDYATLFGDATALWQAECPREYAASISASSPQFYDSSSSSDSSYSAPSSSTSSSSDYSNDWSSSSSEPSSDGGTW